MTKYSYNHSQIFRAVHYDNNYLKSTLPVQMFVFIHGVCGSVCIWITDSRKLKPEDSFQLFSFSYEQIYLNRY